MGSQYHYHYHYYSKQSSSPKATTFKFTFTFSTHNNDAAANFHCFQLQAKQACQRDISGAAPETSPDIQAKELNLFLSLSVQLPWEAKPFHSFLPVCQPASPVSLLVILKYLFAG